MSRPPLLMKLRFQKEDRRFGIWLPLFLLLPVALVVLIILSPLILIAILVLWPSGWGRLALRTLGVSWGLLCSMRGLEVDIRRNNELVFVSVV
ncbi:MAG: hypothetical protein ABID71_03890 [Chloroflexota bacterium]